MPNASDRIKYPAALPSFSGDRRLPARSYLTQLIHSLGAIADLIESIRPAKYSVILWRPDRTVEEQKKALCSAIVDGANSLSEAFDVIVAPHAISWEQRLPS